MTTNIDRAAEVIGEWIDAYLPHSEANFGADEDIARALVDAGLLTPELPEPIINADDGNPEWHADEHTVDVDWGMVGLWTPDGIHWEQTPNQARTLALALLAAADHAEREASHAQDD